MARYWVGGTGNWNDTAHWATSSGGASGASVPDNTQDVFFDTNSHTTSYTATVNVSAACLSITFAAPASNNLTFAGSSALEIKGSMTMYNGMSRTYTGAITFTSTSSGQTITLATNTTASAIVFNGTGGVWTLQDAWNNGASTFTLTAGSFIDNGQTITTTGAFSVSGSTTRAITLSGATNIGQWTATTITNLTRTFTSNVMTVTGNSAWDGGGITTYNEVILAGTSGTMSFNSTSDGFATLRVTNSSSTAIRNVRFRACTISTLLEITGTNGGAARIITTSPFGAGVGRTITVNGSVSLTNVSFQDISSAGSAGTWTGTSIGDGGGNTGITFTTPVTRYWVHGASAAYDFTDAQWSTSSGGSVGASVPLPQDSAVFDANSFGSSGKTVNIAKALCWVSGMNWSAATNAPTLNLATGSSADVSIFGSVVFISGMTLTATTSDIYMTPTYSNTITLTSGGITYPANLKILMQGVGASGTVQLGSDCTLSSTGGDLEVKAGTFNMNGYNMTCANVTHSPLGGILPTFTMGSGTLEMTGTSYSCTGTTTVNANTSTIKFTNSSASTKTFAGNGKTYSTFWVATGSTGATVITGSNTFTGIFLDGNSRILHFTAATTTTFTAGGTGITTNGTGLEIKSATAANHTLTKTAGTVTVQNATITNSQAGGGATWIASTSNGNVDGGSNAGWNFAALALRYWVTGGDGNYNNTNNWSLTSGGASGASVPDNTLDAIFDASSGSGTATVNVSSACLDLTCTGFTGTLAGSSALEIKGSLTLAAGMTITYSGDITMTATDSQTMTFAGKEMASGTDWVFNGTGGTWTLQDAWSVANANGAVTLTAGTLNTNGQTVTNAGIFTISGSTARTLTLGASTITVETQWNAATTTNLTFNANTSVIDVIGSSSGLGFEGGGLTYNEVKLRNNGRLFEIKGANTFATLRFAPFSGHGTYMLYANQTVSGTLEMSGLNQRTGRLLVQSDTLGTARTITCAGTVTLTNVDFRDFTAGGGGAGFGTGTSVGNCGGNTGVTFTTPVTRYWVHGAAASYTLGDNQWAASSGGATGASFPLPQDTAVFDANSFSGAGKTVTIPTATEWTARYGAIQWSGIVNSPAFTFDNASNWYGDFLFNSGVTVTGLGAVTILGRGSASIGTSGNTITPAIDYQGIGGTLTFTTTFVSSQNFTQTHGTVLTGNIDITVLAWASTSSNTRVFTNGSGTITITGSGTCLAFVTTGLTYTKGTKIYKLTNSSVSSKTYIAIAAMTHYEVWVATGNTGTNNFGSGDTWTIFKADAGRSLKFTHATTNTAQSWDISGSLGNVTTISSIVGGNAHTLAKAASGTTQLASFLGVARANLSTILGVTLNPVVSLDYMNITDSTATPANTWYAGLNSTNGGGNSGWLFQSPPNGPGLASVVGISNQ